MFPQQPPVRIQLISQVPDGVDQQGNPMHLIYIHIINLIQMSPQHLSIKPYVVTSAIVQINNEAPCACACLISITCLWQHEKNSLPRTLS